jgi:ATP-binding cassette subfamily F protein 3
MKDGFIILHPSSFILAGGTTIIACTLDRVGVAYATQPIFDDLSWEIHDDRVVGLVGPNGAGKSTLLRLIAGVLPADRGALVRARGLSVGYLPQEPILTPGRTVWEEALTASSALAQVEAEMAAVEERLADPAVYGDERALARTLARQERLIEEFAALGGPAYEGRVRATLRAMGFSDADLELPVEVLSGGQRKLVGLARLLVDGPRLLLLDEPDNHLDLASKSLLERAIRDYDGGVIIVSHDRFLLDLVVDEIAELEDGRLSVYPGNYSEYAFEKRARLLRQQALYQAQQHEIQRLERSAERLMAWGRIYNNEKFAKRGQAIMKRLEKVERIDRPVLERRRMELDLAGWRGSNKVLEISDLAKAFPGPGGPEDHLVLAGLDLLLWHGERVGLVGPNGAGKSVLLRLILGEEAPTAGRIALGPSVRVGYYAQQHETLDPARTLIETIRYAAPLSEAGAVSFLGSFLFTYEQACGAVGNLSGGERSRLQMALLMLSGANLLLLDEPTNNLDIASAEVLEEALDRFEGTVLVISHDRYFLDRVVERVVELDEGLLTEYAGGFSDYSLARARRP